MGARQSLTRGVFVAVAAALTVAITLTGPTTAAQPPGSIEEQIAAAEAELKAAQAQVANAYEAFEAADQQYQSASAAAATAAAAATQTRAEADAATTREQQARQAFDDFTAATYRHGSAIFSARAYLGAGSPEDLLDRASLMTVLASEHGDVMDTTRVAVEEKSVADQEAQAALDKAVTDRDAANNAKTAAEQAYNAAVATQNEIQAETDQLAARRADLVAQSTAQSGSATTTASGPVVRPAVGRLTSTYGPRWGRIHFGIDIANSIGTPILSAMAGEVVDSGPASGFGLWVRVRHQDGLITVYGHINESLVTVGQRVDVGEQIATLGNRGDSTGPHLHFEVHQDGNKIDPLPWLRSHGVEI